jgi:NADPH-dependent F420 reductase
VSPPVLAVLGGTGSLGLALARRWSAAGIPVVIGSRDAARAAAAAAALGTELAGRPGHAPVRGTDNRRAARQADVVVVSVPYEALASTAEAVGGELAGKTVVSAVVPLRPPRTAVVWLPPAGSAAAELAMGLPDARVVAAFQNVAAAKLAVLDAPVRGDVLVCGDDRDAKAQVVDLAGRIGLRALDAGPLANAGVVEGLTALLIGLNRRHRATTSIEITGLDRSGP